MTTKTREQVRDEMAERLGKLNFWYSSQVSAFKAGFDSGAQYEREMAQVLESSLERIVGMVEQWTDEHGQRRTEEIYASKIAREALDKYRSTDETK